MSPPAEGTYDIVAPIQGDGIVLVDYFQPTIPARKEQILASGYRERRAWNTIWGNITVYWKQP